MFRSFRKDHGREPVDTGRPGQSVPQPGVPFPEGHDAAASASGPPGAPGVLATDEPRMPERADDDRNGRGAPVDGIEKVASPDEGLDDRDDRDREGLDGQPDDGDWGTERNGDLEGDQGDGFGDNDDPPGDEDAPPQWPGAIGTPVPARPGRPRQLVEDRVRSRSGAADAPRRFTYTPQQRLLLLDTWQRSGLPAGEFSQLVSVSKHTLYNWKKQFEQLGPEGLMDQPRKATCGSRLSEVTRRTIVMLKRAHPEWGVERISAMLVRGPALSASPAAISRVLREAGFQSVGEPTVPNRPPTKVQRFERARPNQLWQTDLFTFMLKRQNRRLHLVAFMDDHSRFIVSFGLHASATTPLVIEALEAGIASYGAPQEVLTDNGPQYVTWRGKSRFTRQLEKRGIRQIVARPRRPQTLGKIERFWGTLWRELIEGVVFTDLGDARLRIGHFIDWYNFQRPHRGVDGLVPADRFFGAATDVLRTLRERVAANALELARHGEARAPFYVTGQVSGQSFSVHAEGERLVLNRTGQQREEIELVGPGSRQAPDSAMPAPVCPQAVMASLPGEPAEEPAPAPGQSAIDGLPNRLSSQGGQP